MFHMSKNALSEAANAEIQDRLTKTTPPMDILVAKRLLLEVKSIMDEFKIKFFLRQGTCLAAVRDNAFIPWDDDLDIGVLLDAQGFSEQAIPTLLAVFNTHGYYTETGYSDSLIVTTLSKDNIRVDLLFLRIVEGQVYHWPGIWFPSRLFTELKEIDFLDETFLVPNPPEEYLMIKYGPEWRTPKQHDYAKDVVDNIPIETKPRFTKRLKHFFQIFQTNTARIQILDTNGLPVHKAKVRLVGFGVFETNKTGYANLYLDRREYADSMPATGTQDTGIFCSLVITYNTHEEVLYEEILAPGFSYIYRQDPIHTKGRIFVLSQK